ncbi:MAG: DNA modification methylase, partial [Candidatus Omnitrophica bacterium]|nr:DNA modification methylase [Candidatus Omnitrophota bacterium]
MVGGNQRLKALRDLGHKEVQVVYVDLTLEREKALNLALNKISGDWDKDKLAEIIDELTKVPDFDVELTGFDDKELSRILDEHLSNTEETFDAEKERQSVGEAVTKLGDIILLGSHRLLCGDSSKVEDVSKLLEGKKAALVFTDPPYNVNYSSGSRPAPDGQSSNDVEEWSKIKNDNMPQAEYEVWLGKVFSNLASSLGSGAAFYIWNGHRQFGPMHQLLTAQGCHISCVITWAKERFALGYGDYNQ